jgi:hypothetical protein
MNEDLCAELLCLKADDMATRRRLIEAGQLYGPHLPKDWYHPDMANVHRRNSARLREIIAIHGFPTRSLVGEEGCEAAWSIAQHAILDVELQEHCVELLKKAVAAGEAPAQHYAMLTDRVLFGKGEPQLYGSIFVGGDEEGKLIAWTIADAEHVDQRRAAMGMLPIAEHTQKLQQRVDIESSMQRAAR